MTDWTPPIAQYGQMDAATLNTYWRDNLSYLAENLPHAAYMWHSMSLVTAGNALAKNTLPGQWYNRTWSQSASADADSFTQSFECAAGTYTLYVLARKTASSGKVDWSIDGSGVASGMDFYNAATQTNQVLSAGSISIAVGRHVLTGTVNGKNVGSSGYDVEITQMWLIKA